VASNRSSLCSEGYPVDAAGMWSVEIYLSPGGVVRERTAALDPRQAVEAALARSYIVPAQVEGVSAFPIPAPSARAASLATLQSAEGR
jgi:hypothetical protein